MDNAGDVVIENLNEGSDTVYASVDYRLTANVEYLVLQGSAGQGVGTGGRARSPDPSREDSRIRPPHRRPDGQRATSAHR